MVNLIQTYIIYGSIPVSSCIGPDLKHFNCIIYSLLEMFLKQEHLLVIYSCKLDYAKMCYTTAEMDLKKEKYTL